MTSYLEATRGYNARLWGVDPENVPDDPAFPGTPEPHNYCPADLVWQLRGDGIVEHFTYQKIFFNMNDKLVITQETFAAPAWMSLLWLEPYRCIDVGSYRYMEVVNQQPTIHMPVLSLDDMYAPAKTYLPPTIPRVS